MVEIIGVLDLDTLTSDPRGADVVEIIGVLDLNTLTSDPQGADVVEIIGVKMAAFGGDEGEAMFVAWSC